MKLQTSKNSITLLSCVLLAVIIFISSASMISAQTLTVTVYTAANDCTGVSRSAYYANDQCVSATTASVKYGCNSTRATVQAFQNSGSCDGASFAAYVALDTCAQISSTSSWKFSCGAEDVAKKVGVLVVMLMVSGVMLFQR